EWAGGGGVLGDARCEWWHHALQLGTHHGDFGRRAVTERRDGSHHRHATRRRLRELAHLQGHRLRGAGTERQRDGGAHRHRLDAHHHDQVAAERAGGGGVLGDARCEWRHHALQLGTHHGDFARRAVTERRDGGHHRHANRHRVGEFTYVQSHGLGHASAERQRHVAPDRDRRDAHYHDQVAAERPGRRRLCG